MTRPSVQPKWSKLTRKDLRAFDDSATAAVLYAMDRGGVGRVSRKGHAVLRSPDGRTMAVTANSNKSKQIVSINVKRLFPDNPVEATKAAPRGPERDEVRVMEAKVTVKHWYHCPAKGCEETFAVEGGRYSHITTQHKKCAEPGCQVTVGDYTGPFVSRDGRGLAGHVSVTHRGNKPWEHRANARRKEKAQPAVEAKPVPGPTPPRSSATANLLAAIERLEGVVGRAEADGGPVVRLDRWVSDEREKLLRQIAERDERIAKLEEAHGELVAKIGLLREALEA